MESRELIIVAPIHLEGELAENPIIEKINTIIDFINKNRYRISVDEDAEYKLQNPYASKRADIDLREQMAKSLSDPANIIGILKQVEDALEKKYANNPQLRTTKAAKFNAFLNDFAKHIQFIHLTAVELAMIGMMIDTLIILLYQARIDMRVDSACISVLNKQNELLRIRDKVAACMAYHKAVFESNNIKQNKNKFHYSDVITHLYEAIESDSGISLGEERKNLWPDMSYLGVLPEVPFYKSQEPKTVAVYFKEFIESRPPGVEKIDQLHDDLRRELDLLSMDELDSGGFWSAEDEVVSTGCFSALWMWGRAQPTSKSEQVFDEVFSEPMDSWMSVNDDESSIEADAPSLDDVIKLINSFTKQATDQLDKLDLETTLRKEMSGLQNELSSEIEKLNEPGCFSCFSFFWSGTLHKKLVKQAALSYVLRASTLEEIGQRASEKLSGDDKDTVCAGWNSRTEMKLRRIVEVVDFNCTTVARSTYSL